MAPMAPPAAVPLLAAFAAGCLATAALAHGGQYRGGWNDPPPPPSTPGAGVPGPVTPAGGLGGPGPLTGGRPTITDGTSWQVWWEFNKEPLLDKPAVPSKLPITGSDEFFLGPRRNVATRDALGPSAKDRRDLIVPALLEALRENNSRDVITACLVALGKVGLEPPGVALLPTMAPFVSASEQEVRETAALAMGILGQPAALDSLIGLLEQDRVGRALAGKDEVPDRTRTFAAWSLGLLAHESIDLAVKRRVHDALLARLLRPEEKGRDLRVALIQGLGLLGLDPARSGGEKLLLWRTVGELWDFYGRDLGKGDQLVQAHVPVAVARLLGRGDGPEHRRSKALLGAELFPRERRNNAILQSAAMALGSLCLPAETLPEDAAYSQLLQRYYREGTDQQARMFAVMALGRIGGAANRAALMALYEPANKATEKPWVALALAQIAREQVQRPGHVVDVELGQLLHRDVQLIDNDEAQAALALALGLCGYREAGDTLIELLHGRGRSDMLAGYLAVALALLDYEPAKDPLVDLMERSLRRPFVLQQCAVALGRLGDVRVVPRLLDMIGKSDSTAALSAVATALGFIRDRRSIEPLIAALRDPERTKLARAFAAAALGGVGDKSPLPWNTVIAVDVNYRATVDTLTNGSSGVLDIL